MSWTDFVFYPNNHLAPLRILSYRESTVAAPITSLTIYKNLFSFYGLANTGSIFKSTYSCRDFSKHFLPPLFGGKNSIFNWVPKLSPPPACIYLVKVNRNTRTRCEICSKLTIKTPERRHWRRSGVFIVNFEHIFTPCSYVSIVTFE